MGLGEFDRIDRFFKPLAESSPGALGLNDDAALLPVGGMPGLVVSTDAIVEGVHFRTEDRPDLIARKALRTNLSDLAAMGAEPWVYTLTLALGPSAGDRPDDWVERFAGGLAVDQSEFAIGLIGGDSVSTPGPSMISITVLGRQSPEAALRRNGARNGDDIYVSGTLGDAALGLRLLHRDLTGMDEHPAAILIDRYHLPRPRCRLGMALVGSARAAMDISDGLAQDLTHLCRASGVAADVEWPRIPLSDPARAALIDGQASHDDILGGGDDYELLFTAPASMRGQVERLAVAADTPVARIGAIHEGEGVTILDHAGRVVRLRRLGYRHA